MLSVPITTYNHQDYIEQFVMNAVSQKTNFDFKIVMEDVFSIDIFFTDKFFLTKAIIRWTLLAKNVVFINGNNENVWKGLKYPSINIKTVLGLKTLLNRLSLYLLGKNIFLDSMEY
jgi:hypothetical protein